MVICLAKQHEVVTIDGRENCPMACTTTMYIETKTGQPYDYDCASDQPLATGDTPSRWWRIPGPRP